MKFLVCNDLDISLYKVPGHVLLVSSVSAAKRKSGLWINFALCSHLCSLISLPSDSDGGWTLPSSLRRYEWLAQVTAVTPSHPQPC